MSPNMHPTTAPAVAWQARPEPTWFRLSACPHPSYAPTMAAEWEFVMADNRSVDATMSDSILTEMQRITRTAAEPWASGDSVKLGNQRASRTLGISYRRAKSVLVRGRLLGPWRARRISFALRNYA